MCEHRLLPWNNREKEKGNSYSLLTTISATAENGI